MKSLAAEQSTDAALGVLGRGRSADQFIPGWPYSFVAALETGRTTWTAVLDAIRLGPADDATAVTATQLCEVVTRLAHAGQWRPGGADILVVMDTGYDVTRLAHVLADLPVELVGPAALGPRHAPGCRTASLHPSWRAAPQARRRPHLLQAGVLAQPRPDHDVRHHPLRHGRSTRLGPDATSGCSSRPWAGPSPRSAIRTRPTCGPG